MKRATSVGLFIAVGGAIGFALGLAIKSPMIGVGLGAINGGALGLLIRLWRGR